VPAKVTDGGNVPGTGYQVLMSSDTQFLKLLQKTVIQPNLVFGLKLKGSGDWASQQWNSVEYCSVLRSLKFFALFFKEKCFNYLCSLVFILILSSLWLKMDGSS
jgi:hypothetical protein